MREIEFLEQNKKKTKAEENKTIVSALSFPFIFIIVLGASIFIGYKLDKWIGTSPLFLIILIIMGIIVSYYRFFKMFLWIRSRNGQYWKKY